MQGQFLKFRWDFRKNTVNVIPIQLNDDIVQVSNSFKYLGLTIDDKLNFKDHIDNQIKKVQKRLYCIRSMRKLNVNADIITMFYNSTVTPVLMYASLAFYSLISNQLRSEMDRPRRICQKVLKRNEKSILCTSNNDTYRSQINSSVPKILKDPTHPLNYYFQLLPSGRRYRVPKIRTTRFKNSFVVQAILDMNSQ